MNICDKCVMPLMHAIASLLNYSFMLHDFPILSLHKFTEFLHNNNMYIKIIFNESNLNRIRYYIEWYIVVLAKPVLFSRMRVLYFVDYIISIIFFCCGIRKATTQFSE